MLHYTIQKSPDLKLQDICPSLMEPRLARFLSVKCKETHKGGLCKCSASSQQKNGAAAKREREETEEEKRGSSWRKKRLKAERVLKKLELLFTAVTCL